MALGVRYLSWVTLFKRLIFGSRAGKESLAQRRCNFLQEASPEEREEGGAGGEDTQRERMDVVGWRWGSKLPREKTEFLILISFNFIFFFHILCSVSKKTDLPWAVKLS